MTRYVTIGDAMAIVAINGWHPRDVLALDAVVNRPKAFMYGVELYPGLHAKAAALMDSANRQHPLLDGNKRLSWLLVTMFYELNGYDLDAGIDEAETFVLDVASEHRPIENIATWLADHTIASEGAP